MLLTSPKELRIKHPELGLILKVKVEFKEGDETPILSPIRFGLPQKATKLEKLLLKFVEIYCYDVLQNNMHDVVVNSREYNKLLMNRRFDIPIEKKMAVSERRSIRRAMRRRNEQVVRQIASGRR